MDCSGACAGFDHFPPAGDERVFWDRAGGAFPDADCMLFCVPCGDAVLLCRLDALYDETEKYAGLRDEPDFFRHRI